MTSKRTEQDRDPAAPDTVPRVERQSQISHYDMIDALRAPLQRFAQRPGKLALLTVESQANTLA